MTKYDWEALSVTRAGFKSQKLNKSLGRLKWIQIQRQLCMCTYVYVYLMSSGVWFRKRDWFLQSLSNSIVILVHCILSIAIYLLLSVFCFLLFCFLLSAFSFAISFK